MTIVPAHRLLVTALSLGLLGGLCACSAPKPAKKAAAVGAASATAGAVVKSSAKSSAKDRVTPDRKTPDRDLR